MVVDIAKARWIRWFAGESLVQEEEEKVRFGVCPVRERHTALGSAAGRFSPTVPIARNCCYKVNIH